MKAREIDDKQFLNDHIVKIAELSFRLETDRYNSLVSSSGRLLTCISIFIVALAALVPQSFTSFPNCTRTLSLEFAGVASLITASFVCALIAQYRFRYDEPLSPVALADHVLGEIDEFKSNADAVCQYAGILEAPYRSMRKRNERISVLLRASTILLLVAVGAIVICTLVDIPIILFLT